MEIKKKIVILVINFILIIFLLSGCQLSSESTDLIELNDTCSLQWYHYEDTGIYKEKGDGCYEILIIKHFMYYTKTDNIIILVEETDDLEYIYWTFNTENETLNNYSDFSDIPSTIDTSNLKWEKLKGDEDFETPN